MQAAPAQLAPTGALRAGINLANFLLVSNKAAVAGVAPNVAAAIAAELEVPLSLYPLMIPLPSRIRPDAARLLQLLVGVQKLQQCSTCAMCCTRCCNFFILPVPFPVYFFTVFPSSLHSICDSKKCLQQNPQKTLFHEVVFPVICLVSPIFSEYQPNTIR